MRKHKFLSCDIQTFFFFFAKEGKYSKCRETIKLFFFSYLVICLFVCLFFPKAILGKVRTQKCVALSVYTVQLQGDQSRVQPNPLKFLFSQNILSTTTSSDVRDESLTFFFFHVEVKTTFFLDQRQRTVLQGGKRLF